MSNELTPVVSPSMPSRLKRVGRRLEEFASQEHGQGLVEYALVLVLVSIVAIVALDVIGGNVTDIVSTTARAVHP